MKLKESEINYLEFMCIMLIQSLRDVNKEYKENEYIYSSSNRARFDRLRIELNKSLNKIKNTIYDRR